MVLTSKIFRFSIIRHLSSITPAYSMTPIVPKTFKMDSPHFSKIFTPQLKKLSDLFKKNNFEIKIAGGAVRDLLMGIEPADVDFASTATPSQMKDMFTKEEIRMLHKRGEEHGTITCRIDDTDNFEITTLRVDIICDGRRAEVEYTTNWQLDANRRDLTINSLFLDLDGTVTDYFGGIEDIKQRRVAFVGNAEQRIQEDFLRILRYFRFFGRIAAKNEHDESTLDAIKRNKDGMKGLSAERVWTELKKIVIGRLAPEVMRCMLEECQLNEYLGLPDRCNLDRFEKVYVKYHGQVADMTMVAALCENIEDIRDFHSKTKLSNNERTLAEFILTRRKEAEKAIKEDNMEWWIELLIDMESPFYDSIRVANSKDAVLQLGMSICCDDSLLSYLRECELPQFPVKGIDLKDANVPPGPKMKTTHKYLFEKWKKSSYKMSKEDLLIHAHNVDIPSPPPVNTKKRKIQD